MLVDGKKMWQVAAGDTKRSYAEICLQWDVILNGPGNVGPWPTCGPELRGEVTPRKFTEIQRFFEDVKDGDLVVLRLGTGEIYGVGTVVGDEPQWIEAFADVDGWALEFVRRVRWLWRCDRDGEQGQPKRFPTYTLKLGDTTQEMASEVVKNWIAGLEVNDGIAGRKIVTLPAADQVSRVEGPEIGEYLFDQGIASVAVDHLLREIGELGRIAKWYRRSVTYTSEHETVAYLVVPLLRALGWTPQKMAIEWNGIDIALFGRLPRSNESLVVSVEAKRRDESCLSAADQAATYARTQGRERCSRIVVTDGIRYGVYVRQADTNFSRYPTAYLNLADMRRSYPIYECPGAKDALLYMAPEWQAEAGQEATTFQTYPQEP